MKKLGTGGIIGITLGVILLVLVVGFSVIWGQRSTAIKLENRIEAQYVSNQSTYDNMWKKFKELTQVTELQAEQLKDVYMGLIEGRYQDENLLFKSIQEQNPNIDSSVYTQLQREISAGRDTFDKCQKTVLDMVREYNDYVQTNLLMVVLFQKQPLNEKDYVVTSNQTEEAFNTGKTDEIKLND